MNKQNLITFKIAVVVSLGGFLFGFDASVISGVIGFVGPQFDLSDIQRGWVVSSPSFAAMFAMLVGGAISDIIGRRSVLIFAAFLYALSAILSALALNYEILVIARMIGGLAFGAALVLAPLYIGELAPPDQRGRLVSVQQLNIVIGFSASYFSNYLLLQLLDDPLSGFTELTIWRWMLGVEFVPAVVYFALLFWVPKSPRWLVSKGRTKEANRILTRIYPDEEVKTALTEITSNLDKKTNREIGYKQLFSPQLRLILFLALVLAVSQQVTGINSILFYATTIFEQSGVGKNAAFAQAVLVGIVQVIFTVVTMVCIDKIGRKPLMLLGLAGIAISMAVAAYGFGTATYKLSKTSVDVLSPALQGGILEPVLDVEFASDLDFKEAVKAILGDQLYASNESELLESAVSMNATLVLIGILGFMASFSISVGPVMWVLFSEIFPSTIKGIAIATFGFINSFTSFLVQLVFPWELNNLGNALTYSIFGGFAVLALIILGIWLPETKGRSLEELEEDLIR